MVGILLSLAFHSTAQLNKPIESSSWGNAYLESSKNNGWIQENVIYKPNPPPEETKIYQYAKFSPLTSSNRISEEKLRQYLEEKHSPLAPFSAQLLESDYWGVLIAITYVEQSFYRQPTTSPYNLWGRMYPRCCTLKTYSGFSEAIQDMDKYFREYWEPKIDYVEQLNGKYCYNGSQPGGLCPNWTQNVLKIKSQVENL